VVFFTIGHKVCLLLFKVDFMLGLVLWWLLCRRGWWREDVSSSIK